MESSSRNPGAGEPSAAAGWKISRVVRPSPLFGSNGMRLGPDGWLYVTQVFGSQITAINPATGEKKIISPRGGAIVSPDDLDFDSGAHADGVTEYLNSRFARGCLEQPGAGHVRPGSGRQRNHRSQGPPVYRRMPLAACWSFSPMDGTRLMADDTASVAQRVRRGSRWAPLLSGVLSGDIWRVPLDGGERERFISGMATPPALKFDNRGALIVLESHTGDVTRIDLQSRARSRVATIETGLDNLEIALTTTHAGFQLPRTPAATWGVPNGQKMLEPRVELVRGDWSAAAANCSSPMAPA